MQLSQKPKIFVSTRVMYTIGVVQEVSGLKDDDIVFWIPLSLTGKNIFFDRK